MAYQLGDVVVNSGPPITGQSGQKVGVNSNSRSIIGPNRGHTADYIELDGDSQMVRDPAKKHQHGSSAILNAGELFTSLGVERPSDRDPICQLPLLAGVTKMLFWVERTPRRRLSMS